MLDPPPIAERVWRRTVDPTTLVSVDYPSTPTTDVHVRCNIETGHPVEFYEAAASAGSSASNSTGMERNVAAVSDFVRGSSTSYPFRPGGMDESAPAGGRAGAAVMDANAPGTHGELGHDDGVVELDFTSNLRVVPPGFARGCTFDGNTQASPENDSTAVDAVAAAAEKAEDGGAARIVTGGAAGDTGSEAGLGEGGLERLVPGGPDDGGLLASVDAALEEPMDVGRQVSASIEEQRVWGLVDDGTAEDFHNQVPIMARSYAFELDRFQKLAVMHLERNESVFVAAHTSAGKTVVAE